MIRPITPDDLPRLRQMLQALADSDGGTYSVASVEALAHAAFGLHPLIWGLIHPQGMVLHYPDFSTHRGEPGLYIQDLWVDPAARGTGLARALVKATLSQQDWGAKYICLGVSPENLAANRFYAKIGFQARGYQMMILTPPELDLL